MPDYSKAKIYRIVSPSHPDSVYYGSTTQTLRRRFNTHKKQVKAKHKCASHRLFEYDDVMIELVEECPVITKAELLEREKHYVSTHPNINIAMPGGRDKKESDRAYYVKNRERILKRMNDYYKDSKETSDSDEE